MLLLQLSERDNVVDSASVNMTKSLLGSQDAFPRRRQFDENAIFIDALFFVQLNEAESFVDLALDVEGEAANGRKILISRIFR